MNSDLYIYMYVCVKVREYPLFMSYYDLLTSYCTDNTSYTYVFSPLVYSSVTDSSVEHETMRDETDVDGQRM